jgi:hypothetical protein
MRRNLRSGMAAALAFALLAVIPAVAGDDQGDKVVVTKPGVVFHKAGASDIRGHAVERTVDGALESGYAPCPVCFAKELSMARTGDFVTGGAMVQTFGSLAESIPAPPTSTVTQPFGLRYASSSYSHARKEALKDPYAELYSVVHGRSEQGAYGTNQH